MKTVFFGFILVLVCLVCRFDCNCCHQTTQ